MSGEPQTVRFEPGFFTETSARGAPTRWKSGDRVRFQNGEAKKLGGWVAETVTGATHTGVARKIHEWTSLDGESFVAIGTNTKLYLVTRGVRYNITPIRRTVTLTDPFTTTDGVQTVTVTDANHGAAVGDTVKFSGASTFAGVTIDGEYTVVSVLGNTFTISIAGTPNASTTGGGTVVAQYEINIGTADQTLALGWGVGAYGNGTFGTARDIADSGIVRRMRIWSLFNFGEDLIASPRGGAVYHWDRTNGLETRAVILPDAPSSNQAVVPSSSGDRIICLGAFDSVSNTPDKMLVLVGGAGSLTEFTINDPDVEATHDTYDERLSTGSEIVGGVTTRGGTFVSTDLGLYMMRDDPTDIYSIEAIAHGDGAVGPNAIVAAGGTVYVFARTKFMAFDGVYQELPCEVWKSVFEDTATKLNIAQADKVYGFYNESWSECWWFYPSGASTENDRYVVYNRLARVWFTGTLDRTCAMPAGTSYDFPVKLNAAGTLYTHENGHNDDTTRMEWSLESHDFELGTGKTQMHLSHASLDMTDQVGTVDLYLKTKRRPAQAAYVTKGPYSMTETTERKGVRAKGRQTAIRLENRAEAVAAIVVGEDAGSAPNDIGLRRVFSGGTFGTLSSNTLEGVTSVLELLVYVETGFDMSYTQLTLQLPPVPNETFPTVASVQNLFTTLRVYSADRQTVLKTLLSADVTDFFERFVPGSFKTAVNPFAVTADSTTVTVTLGSHGLSADETVTIRNASAVGGITIDGDYTVVTAPTANTFTITHTSAATSTATGGGEVTFRPNQTNPHIFSWYWEAANETDHDYLTTADVGTNVFITLDSELDQMDSDFRLATVTLYIQPDSEE